MTILKNFDFDALRKKRAAKSAGTGVDLVSGLKQISPDIEKLEPGQTAKIKVPDGIGTRKHVMSITAKLNNLTPKGGEWAGRVYRVINDGEGFTYVQRGEDVPKSKLVERKRGRGGGRKAPAAASPAEAQKAVEGAATGETPAKVEGGATVREHA